MVEVPIIIEPLPLYFPIWLSMQDRQNKDLMQFEFPAENMPGWPESGDRADIYTKAPPGLKRGCQVTGFDPFPTSGFAPGSYGRGKGFVPVDEEGFKAEGYDHSVFKAGAPPQLESCVILVNGQELPTYKMMT